MTIAQLSRQLSSLNSLLESENTFTKCLKEGDSLGAINSFRKELNIRQRMAKSQADKDSLGHVGVDLHRVARNMGYQLGEQGRYEIDPIEEQAKLNRLAKSLDSLELAIKKAEKQPPALIKLNALIGEVLQALNASGLSPEDQQALRDCKADLVALAQGLGYRLVGRMFTPFAS